MLQGYLMVSFWFRQPCKVIFLGQFSIIKLAKVIRLLDFFSRHIFGCFVNAGNIGTACMQIWLQAKSCDLQEIGRLTFQVINK